MIITLDDYWMGRDATYRDQLTCEIIANAQMTVERANALLVLAAADGVEPGINNVTGTYVASGWRPPAINEVTANAAAASKHLLGMAIDIKDQFARRAFARWCLTHLANLEEIGLWMEDPQWTPTWVHVQIVPPGSGRRVYVPSAAPPRVAKLIEQGGTA